MPKARRGGKGAFATLRPMRTWAAALSCSIALGCHEESAPRTPPVEDSYSQDVQWPPAEGWRSEVMKFPLGFATSLPYHGIEVIRFLPGFFDPTATNYWSYAFAWVLRPGSPLDQPALERDLVTYFRGLCQEVGGDKFQFDSRRFKASLHPVGEELHGTVETYDPFKTGQPLTLNVRVRQSTCVGARGERIVLFSMTPRPDADPVRVALDGAVEAFHCSGPALF